MGDLVRLESAVSATASGDLTWERWPYDVVTALGLSGVRNPLGFAVVRYLNNEPSSSRVWEVHVQLVGELVRRGIEQAMAYNAAKDAILIWNDMRCRSCEGRGVTLAGPTCPSCNGTGHRQIPDDPQAVHTAVSCLQEAEQWMERQLSARLRKA